MNWLNDMVSLFFPDYCASCGAHLRKTEEGLCTACMLHLPRTYMHDESDNAVERLFWGRVNVRTATAFLRMPRHGMVHRMMHELKYNDHRQVGITLGRLFGAELKESERMRAFDAVVPVPLHPAKLRLRGYNQCDAIAEGLSEEMKVPLFTHALQRTRFNTSQTRKTRWERWNNSVSLFAVNDAEALSGAHLLLLDDVVTTGATMEACVEALLSIPQATVSVASVAIPVR